MVNDEIFDLGVENEALIDKIGEVDEKWLSESKNRIKLSYDDARKNVYFRENKTTNPKNESDMNAMRPYIISF